MIKNISPIRFPLIQFRIEGGGGDGNCLDKSLKYCKKAIYSHIHIYGQFRITK